MTDNKKKEELRKEIGKILKHEVSERLSADRCKTCKQIDDLFALCESIRAEALKEVGIGEEQNQGSDEAYCDWFECPKCKDTMITSNSKFCPNCGVKLKWLAKLSKGGNNAKT
jgi:hypothetical protein